MRNNRFLQSVQLYIDTLTASEVQAPLDPELTTNHDEYQLRFPFLEVFEM